MNLDDMRYVLSKAYSGPGWKKKVAAMPDNQVIAVYYRVATGRPAMSRKNGKTMTALQAYRNVTEALVEVAEKKAKATYSREPYDFEKDEPQQLTFADIM